MSLSRLFLALLALCCLATDVAAQRRPARNSREAITHQGRSRSFVVRAPARVTQGTKLPLVIVLHGGGGNAAITERMTDFSRIVERDGAIVVYPEGTSRFRNALLTWNAGHCCGYAMQEGVDDVGFINAMLDTLMARYPVDPARVFATGMSNGGMMAHRLGRELSPRIRAIAPVVATVFGDEAPAQGPVSALMINGMLDEAVPYRGGPPGGRVSNAWDGTPARPSAEQGSYWASVNGCSQPQSSTRDRVRFTRYDCPAGRAVELYLIEDNGHAWPKGQKGTRRADAPSDAIDATEVIWAFFKASGRT